MLLSSVLLLDAEKLKYVGEVFASDFLSSDFLSPVTMEPVFLGPSPICSSSPPKLEVNSHCSPSLTGNIHLGFLPYV